VVGDHGDHGSRVASRIVFGDPDFDAGVDEGSLAPSCTFLDVMVGQGPHHVNDKGILPALGAVVATSPDIRVFNMSFGDPDPLNSYAEVNQREKLLLVQDLDNFIFARDVMVVVAAGNTPPGIVPLAPYPDHYDDPRWALGSWASGFNTLACGATVERLSSNGLVKSLGWPSPFSRLGPGLCQAPKPEFAAHGGNTAENYAWLPTLGVWGCNAAGQWEDTCGTSFSAPLLAREAAFALQQLQMVCDQGVRPFASTAKALLFLTAMPPIATNTLFERALGWGRATSERLRRPASETAIFVWQTLLEGTDDIARVQIPVPRDWLRAAKSPRLRLICCWNTPVNEAVRGSWACRRVSAQLRPPGADRALTGSRKGYATYPIIDRTYDLSTSNLVAKKIALSGDRWILELSYEETAECVPTMDFSAQQRVGIAVELSDAAADPVTPQPFIQALPIAPMLRLSLQTTPIATPVQIRQR